MDRCSNLLGGEQFTLAAGCVYHAEVPGGNAELTQVEYFAGLPLAEEQAIVLRSQVHSTVAVVACGGRTVETEATVVRLDRLVLELVRGGIVDHDVVIIAREIAADERRLFLGHSAALIEEPDRFHAARHQN